MVLDVHVEALSIVSPLENGSLPRVSHVREAFPFLSTQLKGYIQLVGPWPLGGCSRERLPIVTFCHIMPT
jgi:hypothetical protein